MIVTNLGGFGAVLVQDTDFKCKDSACYGVSPARHQLFMDYQTLLNRFAAKLGFTALTVDGKIGSGTVKATRKVAKAVIDSGLDLGWVKQLAASDSTKAQVAARISDFAVVAQGLARSMFPAAPPPKRFGPDPRFLATLFPATSKPPLPGRTGGGTSPVPPGAESPGLDLTPPPMAASSVLGLSPTGKKVLIVVGLGALVMFALDRRAKRAPRPAAG